MSQIKKEVFPKPTVSRHVHIGKGPMVHMVQGFTLPGKELANKLFSVEHPVYLHWFCNQGMQSTSVRPTGWIWQLANTPLHCHHFSLLLSHPKEEEEILSSPNFLAWSKICTSESQPWGWNRFALNQLRHFWWCCQKYKLRREMRIQSYICSSVSLSVIYIQDDTGFLQFLLIY